MADAAYCQSLTTDGDGCVCITREAAEKLVTKQKVEKIEAQSMIPPPTIGSTILLSVGLLVGMLICSVRN